VELGEHGWNWMEVIGTRWGLCQALVIWVKQVKLTGTKWNRVEPMSRVGDVGETR